MLDQLDVLITSIQSFYSDCNILWRNQKNPLFNMEKYKVRDIPKMSELLIEIFNYRTFLLNNDIDSELKKVFLEDSILKELSLFVRIKNENSLQDKIDRYNEQERHNYGRESINKCLNDIFGIRIIVDENIDYEWLKLYLEKKYNNIRCIVSNPPGSNYIAVHVYFGKGDNTNMRWELQIWDEAHAKSNEESHRNYKQDYKKWENNSQEEEGRK